MGNFNNDDRSGGGRRNFGRQDFGGRSRERQMYKTTCSSCGKDCEVPFVPSGGRPVFCNECFEKNKGGLGAKRFDNRLPKKSHFEERNSQQLPNQKQFNIINVKLDKILNLLKSTSLAKTTETQITKVAEIVKIPEVQVEKVEEKIQIQPAEPTTVAGTETKIRKKPGRPKKKKTTEAVI